MHLQQMHQQRIELLNWANRNGGYIIEDDYDSEFRYKSRKIHEVFRSLEFRLSLLFTTVIVGTVGFWYFLTIFAGLFSGEQIALFESFLITHWL